MEEKYVSKASIIFLKHVFVFRKDVISYATFLAMKNITLLQKLIRETKGRSIC